MERTTVFTISKNGKAYNITSRKFNLYNKINIPANQLFDAMEELTDTFNNVIGYAILFEID